MATQPTRQKVFASPEMATSSRPGQTPPNRRPVPGLSYRTTARAAAGSLPVSEMHPGGGKSSPAPGLVPVAAASNRRGGQAVSFCGTTGTGVTVAPARVCGGRQVLGRFPGGRSLFSAALFLLGLLAAALTSCTVAHGNRTAGTYTLAAVGTDLQDYHQTAEAAGIASGNNSDSFRSAASVVKTAVVTAGIVDGLGLVKDGLVKVASLREATKATSIKSAAATEQAQIAADSAAAEATTTATAP